MGQSLEGILDALCMSSTQSEWMGCDIMAKWVRHIFRGKRKDGTYFVMSGPAYRGLALVRIEKGMYALVHMRTGLRVITIEGEYSDVRKFGAAIADLAEWETFETPEEAIAEEGLANRIKAIASFYSFDDHNEANQ